MDHGQCLCALLKAINHNMDRQLAPEHSLNCVPNTKQNGRFVRFNASTYFSKEKHLK